MTWREAVKYMEQGGRITRKHWLINDYLYLQNGKLMCDGHYEYLEYLNSTKGQWIKYNRGA